MARLSGKQYPQWVEHTPIFRSRIQNFKFVTKDDPTEALPGKHHGFFKSEPVSTRYTVRLLVNKFIHFSFRAAIGALPAACTAREIMAVSGNNTYAAGRAQ